MLALSMLCGWVGEREREIAGEFWRPGVKIAVVRLSVPRHIPYIVGELKKCSVQLKLCAVK